MMACSYLSAGGLKSEPTSAACWSPPAVAGCLTAETGSALMTLPPSSMTLPTPSMTLPAPSMSLPSGSIGLQSGLTRLPSSSMGLPRALMTQPRVSTIPSSQLSLNAPVEIPNQQLGLPRGSMGLPSEPVGMPSGELELSSRPVGLAGSMVIPNMQMGLPPPFPRPLPLNLHSALSLTGPSAAEPALDLSTSTSSITPPLKCRLPTPEATK